MMIRKLPILFVTLAIIISSAGCNKTESDIAETEDEAELVNVETSQETAGDYIVLLEFNKNSEDNGIIPIKSDTENGTEVFLTTTDDVTVSLDAVSYAEALDYYSVNKNIFDFNVKKGTTYRFRIDLENNPVLRLKTENDDKYSRTLFTSDMMANQTGPLVVNSENKTVEKLTENSAVVLLSRIYAREKIYCDFGDDLQLSNDYYWKTVSSSLSAIMSEKSATAENGRFFVDTLSFNYIADTLFFNKEKPEITSYDNLYYDEEKDGYYVTAEMRYLDYSTKVISVEENKNSALIKMNVTAGSHNFDVSVELAKMNTNSPFGWRIRSMVSEEIIEDTAG